MRFTVHRHAQRQASPRSHRPSDGDVSGHVHVRIDGVTAGPAAEDGLALARLRVDGPTYRATLTGVRGIDLFKAAWSLLLQAGYQPTPSSLVNGSVEPGLLPDVTARCCWSAACRANHFRDLEVLDADHVKATCQVGGDFLDPVLTPVRLASSETGDRDFQASSSRRPPLGTGEVPLQPQEMLGFSIAQARNYQEVTAGQGGGNGDATIDADDLSCTRPADGCRYDGERDMPSARSIPGDTIGLHRRRKWARPAKPYPSDFRNPNSASAPRHPLNVLSDAFADDAESFVTPCLAPRRAAMGSAKIVRHRLIEVPKRLLLHDRRPCPQPRVLGPRFGQLAALLSEPGGRLPARSPVSVLLHRKIPDKSGVCTMLQQRRLLIRRWLEPITGHDNTLWAATDIKRSKCQRDPAEVSARDANKLIDRPGIADAVPGLHPRAEAFR